MKAGKYYIGDLCYLLTDEYYDEIVCSFAHEDQEKVVKGVEFWWHSTAYGDGGYEDQNGSIYSVDAGLIGCVNLDTLPEDALNDDGDAFWGEGGNVVSFKEDFSCRYEEDEGTICIGNIEIKTDPEEDEECYSCGGDLSDGYCCNADCSSSPWYEEPDEEYEDEL